MLNRMATGSGKTLVYLVPTAARWIDGRRLRDATLQAGAPAIMPPLALVIVPWRALGDDQEKEAAHYFEWVYGRQLSSVLGTACFVRRGVAERGWTGTSDL